MIISIDFDAYPDNHQLGPQFTLASTTFRDLGAPPSIVNVTAGDKGLQFPDAGLEISLPAPARWVRFETGQFNAPFTIEGYSATGQLVSAVAVTAPNTFSTQLIAGADPVVNLRLVGGGNEGMIVKMTAHYV